MRDKGVGGWEMLHLNAFYLLLVFNLSFLSVLPPISYGKLPHKSVLSRRVIVPLFNLVPRYGTSRFKSYSTNP